MIKKYTLKNLDCASCAHKIENMINQREDINEATLSFANGLLIIDSNQAIDIHELEKLIQALEPEVTIEEKDAHHHHHHEEHTHHHDECSCGHEHHEHHHEHCECGHDHEEDHRILNEKGTISYHIAGLDCASCAMKVEDAIQKLSTVEEAVLNFSTETLQVKSQGHVEKDVLLKELQKTIDQVEDGVVLSYKNQSRVIEKPQLFVVKDHLSLIVGILVYIVSLIFEAQAFSFVGFLIAYVLIGYDVILKAVKNILRGEIFDENFLMGIATIGAFAIGDYPEAVAVLLFYSIGEIFQSYAVNKTRNSISALMDIKSEYANLKTSNGVQQVVPEEVKVGDILVVKVGEKIPLDGVVVQGHSLLDTSSLTGENLGINGKCGK